MCAGSPWLGVLQRLRPIRAVDNSLWPPNPGVKDPIRSSPPSQLADTRRVPAQIYRIRAGRKSRGVTTPVPRVYLPVSLTGPGPSDSAEPTRLCRGCFFLLRRPPAWVASSFIQPLRRLNDGWSFTPIRTPAPRGALNLFLSVLTSFYWS